MKTTDRFIGVLGAYVRKDGFKFFATIIFVCLTSSTLVRAAQDWTAEDKETWKKAVKRVVTTPPCCGACSVLSMNEGRKAYKYVAGEERSEEGEKVYKEHEKRLLEAFQFLNPIRYQYWFGKEKKEEGKYEK